MLRANFSSRGSHGGQNGSVVLLTFSSAELLDVERSLLLRTRAGTGATGGVCGVKDDERVLKAIPFANNASELIGF